MLERCSLETLKPRILTLSCSSEWEVARKEWALINVIEAEAPQVCLCGFRPTYEICELHNSLTDQTAKVASTCVKKFIGLRSDLIFICIKRLRENLDKSLNKEALSFFYERKILTKLERDLTLAKLHSAAIYLSAAQLESRRAINKKVLDSLETPQV
jgi:hypothetical protein